MIQPSHEQLTALGHRAVASTPHRFATDAAMASFAAGGNAVDAAVAASVMLSVVYPHMCGVGGDVFAIVWDGADLAAVNGSGATAASLDPDWVRGQFGTMPTHGPHSISVPGAVAAWAMLVERYGKLPFEAALQPAAEVAERGTPVARSLAGAILARQERVTADAGLSSIFLHNGTALREGDTVRQPALAATLRALAAQGPAAVYDGETGRRFVDGLSALGSKLTMADLKRHQTEVTAPLIGGYRGWKVAVPPPNSQGFVLLEILGAIEAAGIASDHLGADVALIAGIFLATAEDRDAHLADPRRADVRVGELLSAAHIHQLLERASRAAYGEAPRAAAGDTVGIVAAEQGGPWIALNHSLYDFFGSGILEPATGIIGHNRGSHFSLDPASPNVLAGGKRPAHTLMPVMVMRDGRPAVASATMGGPAHAQIYAEILSGVLDLGLDCGTAVARPRWLTGGIHRGGGSKVVAESRVPEAVLRSLAKTGYPVETLEPFDQEVGHGQIAVRTEDGGLAAAADPRADGSAGAR